VLKKRKILIGQSIQQNFQKITGGNAEAYIMILNGQKPRSFDLLLLWQYTGNLTITYAETVVFPWATTLYLTERSVSIELPLPLLVLGRRLSV